MVAAAVILACIGIDAQPSAADTSTVGWVRLAQLSSTPVDGYLSPSQSAQPALTHAAYGTMSQYQPVAPGGYTVAIRVAGSSATANPLATIQLTVAAGQAYTVAAFGTSAVKLQVLNDALTAPAGKASVRVIEASRSSPAASVMLGTEPLTANLHSPGASPYQTVDPGTSALLVTTKAATIQTISANLAANSTYTVLILDGTEDVARVLVVGDATGMSAMPKGGVSTGFGGTARDNAGGHLLVPALSLAALLVLVAIRQFNRRVPR
jgi:hypothetical protein